MEEISFYSSSIRPLLLAEGKGSYRSRPRLPGHVRREPNLLRYRVEKEIQSPDRFLFRCETSEAAAAEIDQVHQIPLRGGQRVSGTVDGWNQSGQVRKAVDGKLQDTGRRARSGGSRYAGPREVMFG